jgi:hypothetical protein
MRDLARKPSAIIMSPEWAFCHSIVSEMPQGIHPLPTSSQHSDMPIIGISDPRHRRTVIGTL